MYISEKESRSRLKEAENARKNRLEIVKAHSQGQITRREMFKWGLLTSTGLIAAKHGLSPFVRSAYGAVPTGTPRSPLFGAQKFTQPMPRMEVQKPSLLNDLGGGDYGFADYPSEVPAAKTSYHTKFNQWKAANTLAPDSANPYVNPMTKRGPMEGRPWGPFFDHQRWDESWMKPKKGYVMSWGRAKANTVRWHPNFVYQQPDSTWMFKTGAMTEHTGTIPLIKSRYGEPYVVRVYNALLDDPTKNNGFGRNENSLHHHNGHNPSESDGACNAFHYPGTFYDYNWTTTLHRHDTINQNAQEARASGPSDIKGQLNKVPGDYRELQGTLWYHDHRFFFTAENVHKGNFGMNNIYSGPDAGNETISNGVNLRLPSGSILPWGNIDFDVNLAVSNAAATPDGQMYFDIFTTDGFLGDMLLVNGAYAPVMEVLPRKYRFRILNASMSRFIQLAIASPSNSPVPFQFICNDGNFVVNPILLGSLDQQGVAERYDIIVDFSKFPVNSKLHLVNLLQQTDGRKPDGALSMANAMKGTDADPAVGPILQFKVVSQLQSIDDPSVTYDITKDPKIDNSVVPSKLTDQIPIVTPDRTRTIEWVRGGSDLTNFSQCEPDCGTAESFPWAVKVNGQTAHGANANRISVLVPDPGKVEHWTYINGGGGWDHPIHLHFEEGVTINRGNDVIPATEKGVRKDVWRLRPAGHVTFQVKFGEYGGAYVNHCHNTVHEDFAMLLRWQLLAGGAQATVSPTPHPTRDGVTFNQPVTLPEADPANVQFFPSTTKA